MLMVYNWQAKTSLAKRLVLDETVVVNLQWCISHLHDGSSSSSNRYDGGGGDGGGGGDALRRRIWSMAALVDC